MKKLLLPIILTSACSIFAQDIQKSYLDSILDDTESYRESMHNKLVNLSYGVDDYFDETKRSINDYEDTYGIIQLSTYYDKDEGFNFDQKIKIRLKLPKLKEKFKLVFESDEIRENKDYAEDHTKNSKENFNLSLVYEKFKNDIKYKGKAGIKLKSNLNPFVKFHISKTWENINTIDYTLGEELKLSADDDLESTTYFRLDKYLDGNFSLHNYYEHYWQSKEETDNELYASIYLNQKISDKDRLTYTLSVNADNIDSNMKDKRYSAKVKYRHNIRKWLYIDTIPENYYREENDFDSEYVIKFNLGMYINKHSYKRK